MFILMNIYWSEKNLLISSKSIKPESLDDILGDILKKETTITSFLNMPTLSLSRTESSMLRMWMAGQGTIQISDQMNIKAKTVSSHKGNIKRKIKTHNKQVIGNDSNLLIVFYVQIMPDDFVMQLHRF